MTDRYPLSPMQQGMVFHTLLDTQAGQYIGQVIFDFPDVDLNVRAFQQSWDYVVARHPALRTSFHWEGLPAPEQRVHAGADLPFQFEDWRDLPTASQKGRLDAYLRSDRQRGFTLTEAPLMRVAVFRMGEAHYQCVWTVHHLLGDRQAGIVILREVFGLYEAISTGSRLQLPTPRHYREYISWLERQDRPAAEKFWRQALKGFTAQTRLPVGRTADAVYEGPPVEQEISLEPGVTAALDSLAARQLLTVNTFLQGAWALLLSRHSGEDDVVFGASRSCRRSTIEGADAIVGLVMNALPVRVRVVPDVSVRAWLRGLRLAQVPVLKHEHTPLVDVQRWSELPPGTALFESVLNFADQSLNTALCGLGRRWEKSTLRLLEKTNVALTVYASADPDLLVKIVYDPYRFEDDTIRRMLGHLKTLLEAMAANPDQLVADLPLLTRAERHRLLVAWNETAVEYSRNVCIHQLVERQAAQTPDAAAICFDDRWLSYRQLNARANQLGHCLVKAGVRPGMKIGVYIERSLEMMIALLATFKAGATYVPLDPRYPGERLAFILDDAGVEVLLTQERLARTFRDGVRAICLDTDWNAISQEPEENLDRQVSSDELAYVMYTSGSTGRPKGVMVRHRNVVNFFAGMNSRVGSDSRDVWLAVTSISFDISVLELFWPLTHGSRVILHAGVEAGRESIPAQIAKHGVSHLQCTPSLARLLAMSQESLRALKPLRKLLLGGEALPDALADELSAVVSGDILNMYGPTETTIWSTSATLEEGRRPVPIGRPIANTQVYILNRFRDPVPVGVAGELFIGGDGVAAGYHNRPELTAERFVDDPFASDRGRLMYRTGDMARYLPDGNIEFLGRVDHQVKIRGHRVELGEIETVLRQHRGVREAVVVAREDRPGDQRLVGYVVSDPEQAPTESGLRGYLKTKFPPEMIPAAIVRLDALPRTPNGKLDRRALPAPDGINAQTEKSFVAPRDAVERRLAALWERILRVRPIGVRDNFFELGGHSLLVMSLFAQIEKTFGKTLPMAAVFRRPTIEQLAELLRHDEPATTWSALVPIQPHGSRPPIFLLHSGVGDVLEYYPLARRLGPDQPVYALQSVLLDRRRAAMARSARPTIEELAALYIEEIRALQPVGPYYLGGFCLGGHLAYEVAQQMHVQGEEVALLAVIQSVTRDYPRPLPGVSVLQRLHGRVIQRLDLEWSNLKAMEPGTWISQVVDRARRAWTLARVQAETWVHPWLVRFNVENSHSRAFALERIDKLHVDAARNYEAKSYRGQRVALFRASKQPPGIIPDPTMGWGALLNGQLEIHEVPAHHQNILKEPAVRTLASQLTACLDRARSTIRVEQAVVEQAS